MTRHAKRDSGTNGRLLEMATRLKQMAKVAYRMAKLDLYELLTKGNSCVHMATIAYKWQMVVLHRVCNV
jgi:hypothetical protein